jgi:hypothetical protein
MVPRLPRAALPHLKSLQRQIQTAGERCREGAGIYKILYREAQMGSTRRMSHLNVDLGGRPASTAGILFVLLLQTRRGNDVVRLQILPPLPEAAANYCTRGVREGYAGFKTSATVADENARKPPA